MGTTNAPALRDLCDAATVRELIANAAQIWGKATALSAPGTERVFTYRELDLQTRALSERLAGWGMLPGRRVATFLPPGAAAVGVMAGVMSYATYAPLNPRLQVAEANAALRNIRADCVIVGKGDHSAGRAAAEELGLTVIEVAAVPDGPPGAVELSCERPVMQGRRSGGDENLAYVLQTSGTTARPKVVPMAQRALLGAIAHNVALLELTPSDRCLHVVAPAHVMGITTVLYSFMAGCEVICCPPLVTAEFFRWVRRFLPTWMTAPPAMHHSIVAAGKGHEDFLTAHPPRFLRTGAAPISPALVNAIETLWHAPLIEAYAMSECPLITSNGLLAKDRKAGSVGRACCGIEVELLDDGGGSLGKNGDANEVGEIAIRGPHLMPGYENAPGENRDAFQNGWFRTGDLAALDGDGFFYLRGRKKELINRGGVKISPVEIDCIVQKHPAVAQALTFSLPDERLGETIGVAVVLHQGSHADETEIRQFVAGELSPEKIPQRIAFVQALPAGTTGKPLRIGLAAKLGLDRVAPASGAAPPFVAPADTTEQMLAAIWSHVLQHARPISTEAHFVTDLGGDSLQAVAMLTEASRLFNHDLPPAALLAAPTIRRLASVFRNGVVEKPSYLVPIQPNGARPPLFCFPGMFGNTFSYYPLAKALGGQQPLYGFALPGVYDAKKRLPDSIEQLATLFLKEIRRIQPAGPYYLAGYSFGGYLAFEMAQQLSREGESVARLIMFDTRGPGFPQRRNILGRLKYHLARATEGGWWHRLAYLRERAHRLNRRRQKPIAWPATQPSEKPSSVSQHSLRLIRSYRPQRYDGNITMIRASEQPPWFDACVPDPTMGWGRWSRHVNVEVSGGTHVTMLESDNAVELARVVATQLSTASG